MKEPIFSVAKLAKIIEEYNFLVHFYSNFTFSW